MQAGLALHATGQMEQAVACFTQVLSVRPDLAEAALHLGALFLQTGCTAQAVAAYEQLLARTPGHAGALVGLGTARLQAGDPQGARRCCEQVLAADAGNVAAIALAADIDEKDGDPAAAFARLEPLVRAGIADTGVVLTYAAACRSLKRPQTAVAGLLALLQRGTAMTAAERAGIHFALGRLYDAAGCYDEAFASYGEGNRLNYRGFDRALPSRDVERMMAFYTGERMAALPRATNTYGLPVFIVGMHRSGTTLVEQILASHPAVYGAGELPDLVRLLTGLHGIGGSSCRYLDCLPHMGVADLDAVANAYLARLTGMCGGARRVTDKMPGNFLYLGFIRQAFPGARIIHCRRNPLDTCLSGYFQNFGGAQTYMNDLGDLGFVYRCYDRMMAHWRDVLDLPLLEVQYEALVGEPERVIRELVAFCGLDWDARCLAFHDSERYVNTASYDQVRQPMYSRSVNRWKNYDRHLQPLRDALGDLAGDG